MFDKIRKMFDNIHFLSLSGNVVNTVLNSLVFIIAVRLMSLDDFGHWILFSACFTIAQLMKNSFIFTPLVRELAISDSEDVRKRIVGSAFLLNFLISLVLGVLSVLIYQIIPNGNVKEGFIQFFRFYPFFLAADFSLTIAMGKLTEEKDFKRINIIKIAAPVLFLTGFALSFFFFELTFQRILIIQIILQLILSLIPVLFRWVNILYIFKAGKECVKKLFDFGKYCFGTTIAANLLQTSDKLLIGSFLTAKDLAVYELASKLIALLNIVLSSFCDIALPPMSKAFQNKHFREVRDIYYRYSGLLFYLLLVGMIVCFFASDLILYLLGGSKYSGVPEVKAVFNIFLIYGLFITFDRFTGVVLEAINKPQVNLIKVLIMVGVNIAGDIVALKLFNSVEAVAVVTILNVVTGVIIGHLYLWKSIGLHPFKAFTEGTLFLGEMVRKYLKRDRVAVETLSE